MKRRLWKRIARVDRFTLHQAAAEPETFSVRWKKGGGNYGERVFQAVSTDAALKQAPVVAGFEAVQYREQLPLVEAFDIVIAASKRGEKARKDWHYQVRLFARWLADNHPHVGTWNQMSRMVVREYLDSLGGKSVNTRRLAIQPIQQTDGFIAREFGFPRIAEGLRIGSGTVEPPAQVHLADALDFCAFSKTHAPHLEAGIALQGLAGLRVQEVFRLTWEKIDLERGLVQISGEVKNRWSERVIPVCVRVQEALARACKARSGAKLRDVGPESLLVGYSTWEGYSRAVVKVLKRWNPQVAWRGKDLRNMLPTFAISRGIHGDLWEQYLGHASKGVTARHYTPRLAIISRGSTEALENAMDLFRDQIVQPIEVAIQAQANEKVPPSSTLAASSN